MRIQLSHPSRQIQPRHPLGRRIPRQRQADLGVGAARNVLLALPRVLGRGDERAALDHVRGAVRERLVELVHQVRVPAQAAVVFGTAAPVALAVDALGRGEHQVAGAGEEEREEGGAHGWLGGGLAFGLGLS